MANQINIDIGAVANDGTGDPLRTAFNYVNLNFSNVWATGLPNSTVQFNNNRILTVNTNANLVLSPNGTGVVQSNVSIVPNIDRAHNLGSSAKKWDSIYANYLNINDLGINADLTVGGNLTVEGDTIQIGNIITDTKTIQLANTAGTGNAANGSGITVGANDNIATFLYNSNSNSWVTNLAVTYSNGQPVGGQPGGSNGQVQFNSNGVFAGNVNFTFDNTTAVLQAAGNIIPYANLVHSVGSPNRWWGRLYVDTINTTDVVSGEVVALGNLFAFKNVSAIGDMSANNLSVSNIASARNVYGTNGSFSGDQFGDGALYLGFPGGTNLGTDVVIQIIANAGGYSQSNFQNTNSSPSASGDYIVTADNGTDTTHYVDLGMTSSSWDGSETNVLSGLAPNNGYLYVQDGNLTVGTRSGNTSYSWNFDTTGKLTLPSVGNLVTTGNVTANYFLGNTQGLAGNITNLDSLNFSVENISALVGNNGVNIGAGGFNNLVVLPTEVLIQNVQLTVTGTVKTGVFATGNIPSASTAGTGARAFVTDADISTWGNLYVGGAANSVPVWSNGTNWYIG